MAGTRKPDRANHKAPHEKPGDRDRAGDGEYRRDPGIEAPKCSGRVEEADSEADGDVVQSDQREGEKTPEDEGMSQAGQRPFANDFSLAEDLPEEVPDAFADRK